MSTSNALRSRVSRETRQLLAAALIALLALWVLARIRFPGQPVSPNPIPSLLSQLSAAPRFANLAGEIAELQGRLSTTWLAVGVSGADDIIESGARQLTAMRLRSNAAVTLLRSGDRLAESSERHRDRSRDGAHPHSYRRRQRAGGCSTVDAPCARQSPVLHGHGGHIRWRVAATCTGRLAARDAKPGVAWSHLVGAGRDRPHDILVRLYDVGRDRRSRGTRAGWPRDRPVGHRARRSDAHSRWRPCSGARPARRGTTADRGPRTGNGRHRGCRRRVGRFTRPRGEADRGR